MILAGAVVGSVSRAVDTSSWAPSWIGLVLAPWLAFAFGAGALTGRGAAAGVAALAAVVASYLVVAQSDAGNLWLQLAALALIGGAAFGWAGLAWRRGRPIGLVVIGLALVGEGVLLQVGDRSVVERIGFAVELVAGVVVCLASARPQGLVRLRRRAM